MIDTRKKDHFTRIQGGNILPKLRNSPLKKFIKMIENSSFLIQRKFYALEHFPYGIDRSGEFTCEQADLLINHGHAYDALANGSRKPVTAEEERFVAVCLGNCEAETRHEKAWMVYLTKTMHKYPSCQSPLVGSKDGAVDFSIGAIEHEI